MKSRTSCCKAAFWKDVTRFAPVWGLYTVCLFMGLMLMAGGEIGASLPSAMASCVGVMAVVNCGYGLVAAQVLFGDLMNSRLCFGLHSLPIKRDQWFCIHTLSGLLFSLVPTALMSLVALILMETTTQVPGVWQIAGLWWLGANLQYIFFFGAGILSMMLSGSRLGAALIYGVINLAAVGCSFLYGVIYLPMFYGFPSRTDGWYWFAPMVQMCSMEYIDTDIYRLVQADSSRIITGTFQLLPNWWYLFACGGVGVLLGQLGLESYRRRSLEAAGDTVAFRWIKPFFLMAAALAAAVGSQCVLAVFFGWRNYEELNLTFFLQLVAFLALGWFAGLMILNRTTRVFTKKAFLGLTAFTAAFFLTVGLAWLDPLGVEDYIPDREDIKSVRLEGHGYPTGGVELFQTEDIENLRTIHGEALKHRLSDSSLLFEGQIYEDFQDLRAQVGDAYLEEKNAQRAGPVYARNYTITYTLESGREVTRNYRYFPSATDGQLLKNYFTRFDFLTGYHSWAALLPEVESVGISYNGYDEELVTDPAAIRELVYAIDADCKAGRMAQGPDYHPDSLFKDENGYVYYSYHMDITCRDWDEITHYKGYPERARVYIGLYVYSDCENVLAWMEKYGLAKYSVA